MLEAAWAKEIIETTTPQFERLALLWLDHFSVAFDTYEQTHSFAKHLGALQKNEFVRKCQKLLKSDLATAKQASQTAE